jgi:hypothetical protein
MKWLRQSSPAVLLLAGIVVFAAMQREPLQAEARPATTWDYKVIVVSSGNPPEIASKLSAAGADGWECVGLSFSPSGRSIATGFLVLKRQK